MEVFAKQGMLGVESGKTCTLVMAQGADNICMMLQSEKISIGCVAVPLVQEVHDSGVFEAADDAVLS